MMGFAIAPSPRVLNKLALQTCHKAASGCKGLFGLVANMVGRAGAWWPRAADVPGAGGKGAGSLEPKELGISGGRLSQARTVLAHSSGLARAESKATSFGMSAYKLASGLAAVPTAVLQNKLNKVVQRRADLPAKERRVLGDALRAVAKRFEQIADKIDIEEPPEMAYTRQAVKALRLALENKLAPIDPKEVIRAANAEITESDAEAARMVAQAWDFVAKQLERLRSDRGPDAARG